jgi:hypothetical protein
MKTNCIWQVTWSGLCDLHLKGLKMCSEGTISGPAHIYSNLFLRSVSVAGVTSAAVVLILRAVSGEVVGNVGTETASLMAHTRINQWSKARGVRWPSASM